MERVNKVSKEQVVGGEKVLDLKDFVKGAKEVLPDSLVLDYPGFPSFKVTVALIGKEELEEIADKVGVSPKKGFRQRRRSSKAEDQKFVRLFADKAIKHWTGLTLDILKALMPVNLSVEGKVPVEIKCNSGNKTLLVENSMEFSLWLNDVCSDVEEFNKAQEKQLLENLKKG